MKRFIWGIVLAVFGGLAVLGGTIDGDNPDGIFGGVLMIIGGGTMIYFGRRYLQRKQTTTEIALQMLRENQNIDAADLSRRMNLSEVEIRMYLAESQREGVIPFKADVV